MMKDLYIKNKRILLFDFDGTLVGKDLNIKIKLQDIYSEEFDTPPVCKPPLFTLKVRIKKDQDYRGYSDIIRIDKGDNNITFTSLYHESKESSDSLS